MSQSDHVDREPVRGRAGTLMVGRTLGHYTVLARLGAGGMGEVYRARDTTLGRDVALKVLPEAVSGDPERLRRLQREARALASLNHPGIVTVYSVEEAEGTHFLTMELVSGRPLTEIIPGGVTSLDRFLALAVPLAEAVAAAHERGVVHRDLKPANVMVAADGRVKVLDFGLAALRLLETEETRSQASLEPLTRTGAVVGTVPYMSPEQLQGRPVDARSDVFSLGIVLYEMACGQRPFGGESAATIVSAILRDTPPPLASRRSDLPERFDRIIRRCLAKEPRERYQSVTDLAHDLAELRAEVVPHATVAPVRSQPAAASRRRWWPVAVALVLALVAVGAWYLLAGRARPVAAPGDGPIRSIAVLPFTNMMKDAAQDYFVDGMQETLLTALAKVRELRVISRTSVMQYRGTTKTIPEIARELGVDAVIEGSVLRDGRRVRITAQLIRASSDRHVWAESYDRDVENVLSLLSEVAEAIAGEVKVALTPEQKGLLRGQNRPVSPEAQEAFLRGQEAMNLFTREGNQKALAFFHEALDLDPDFASAWSALSWVELMRILFDSGAEREKVRLASEAAARKALDLDPTQGLAWGALGMVDLYSKWDWPAAREALERAVELDPTNAWVRHGCADLLLVEGRLEESLDQVKVGRANDPLSPVANGVVVAHLVFAHRFEEALGELTRLEKLFSHPMLRIQRWNVLWQLGRQREALDSTRADWKDRFPEGVAALDRGLAEGGPRGAAVAIARTIEPMARAGRSDPLYVASLYARGGDTDGVMPMLELAFADHDPFILHIKADPAYDAIHDDPRFQDLLRRIGFPD